MLQTECICPLNIHMLKSNLQGDSFRDLWEVIRLQGGALLNEIAVVQSLSPVWLCNPMDCSTQASRFFTISQCSPRR